VKTAAAAREPAAGDRGSASLWLLGVGLAILTFGAVVAGVGSVLVARHRAQAAADLGALAGAGRAVEGAEAACGRAGDVVLANGGRIVGCTVDGLDVTVRAEVDPVGPGRVFGPVSARARAGPVRTPAQVDGGGPVTFRLPYSFDLEEGRRGQRRSSKSVSFGRSARHEQHRLIVPMSPSTSSR
jgi:secretion/DNA translocation related TadE-like protein